MLCVLIALIVWIVGRVLDVSPSSPFIVSRGTQDFTCVTSDLLQVSGEATVPTLLRFAHPILEVWLTAWLLLWRVAEPC